MREENIFNFFYGGGCVIYVKICSPESPSCRLCGKHSDILARQHYVVYIVDVSSDLGTTGRSRDRVLRRTVSSSDETVSTRVFIAGRLLALSYFIVILFILILIISAVVLFFFISSSSLLSPFQDNNNSNLQIL